MNGKKLEAWFEEAVFGGGHSGESEALHGNGTDAKFADGRGE